MRIIINIEQEYNRQVAKVDSDFQNALLESETNFLLKKKSRTVWRNKSFQSIVLSLGVVFDNYSYTFITFYD